MEKTPTFPNGRPKRYWITEQQRMTQARKSWKTLIDIRDGRVKEQEWDEVKREYVSIAASIKDVLTASIKIMAYAVGEPTKTVALTGEDDGPLVFQVIHHPPITEGQVLPAHGSHKNGAGPSSFEFHTGGSNGQGG